ncbi:Intraflagellar transport protein 56 [Perkinsus chesapeaki]|uniref:Intraflagellar transport protein 56 n=1 Tax=Perkinsus chesapeaki TaxID=330153 RepID=A0A7J6N2Z9_PERCH|nr:Intraflagellar transport protein 56 [Perkinsus chesapeaki]
MSSSSSYYNRADINQMFGMGNLCPNTTTTTAAAAAASPLPMRTSRNNDNVYFTPPYGYSVDPSVNRLFADPYNSSYKHVNGACAENNTVYSTTGEGSYRNLSEANAMLTAACSNLLEALQNPNNRYQKDQCIEEACNALIVGQQVQATGCSNTSIQQPCALPCTSSNHAASSSLLDTPYHTTRWSNNTTSAAAAATGAAGSPHVNNRQSRVMVDQDGGYHGHIDDIPFTGQQQQQTMLISSSRCNDPSGSKDTNHQHYRSSMNSKHHYHGGYHLESRLPICYESSPSTSTSATGQLITATTNTTATITGRSPRRKAYGAPTGVWKNPYGFVSTIYVNKRRVYGPLRKTIDAATRDREALLSVKDIITSVEEMRLFVKDVLKPNADGGVTTDAAYDIGGIIDEEEDYTYKKKAAAKRRRNGSSSSSSSVVVDGIVLSNNHTRAVTAAAGEGGGGSSEDAAAAALPPSSGIEDNGGMFVTL